MTDNPDHFDTYDEKGEKRHAKTDEITPSKIGEPDDPVDEQHVVASHIDVLNSADLANASAGTVPKAQGDGTLAMGSAGSLVHLNTLSEGNGYTAGDKVPVQLTGGYDRYILTIANAVPVTDGNGIQIQFSTDGGSTWVNGSTDYEWALHYTNPSSSGGVGTSGDFFVSVATAIGSATGEGASLTVSIIEPSNSSTRTAVSADGYQINDSGTYASLDGGGQRLSTEAHDAIRIQTSGSDGLSEGTVALYGVRQ